MEECKDLANLAKQKEKDSVIEAADLFEQAANCFGGFDNFKEKKLNLDKAAKLLRELAKSIEDPIEALIQYEKSSSIYKDIDKQGDADKVIQEAHQKFTDSAKILKNEASKMEDVDLALKKLKQASDYALQGNNEQLHNDCWVDSGDIYQTRANPLDDPRKALEVFKEAASVYKKGNNKKKEDEVIAKAADKFMKKATDIHKTQKTLVLALDNYTQAYTLYRSINLNEKASQNEKKIQEICDLIGIAQDPITEYLKSQGITSILISQEMNSEIKETKADLLSERNQTEVEGTIEESIKIEKEANSEEKEEETTIEKEPKTELVTDVQEIPALEVKDQSVTEKTIVSDDKLNEEKIPEPIVETPPTIQDLQVDFEEKDEVLIIQKETPKMDHSEIKNEITSIIQEKPDFVEKIIDEKPDIAEPIIEIPSDTLEEIKSDSSNDLNFEIKDSSSIKDRIKSELRGQEKSSSLDVKESTKKTADIEDLFDDALDESMEDFLSDFDDVIVVKKGGKPVITGPIIEILREQGYIKEDLSKEEELQKVPEYQILLIIIREHPIPLEKIEEKSDIESVSLVISNLQADNLIEQTNDYQWTISQKVKDNIREFMSQTSEESKDEDVRSTINRNSKYEHLLIVTLYKLGVIPELDVSVMELMQIPEFAVIKTIKDKEPVEFSFIIDVVTDIPPVQVTRMLSKLESEERIAQNSIGQWLLSDKLVAKLVEK